MSFVWSRFKTPLDLSTRYTTADIVLVPARPWNEVDHFRLYCEETNTIYIFLFYSAHKILHKNSMSVTAAGHR